MKLSKLSATQCGSSRAGLQDPKRPIASFILSVPRGLVGLGKSLGRLSANDENMMTRIDMSIRKSSVYHVWSELLRDMSDMKKVGNLPKLYGANPYSVVLFDEIEKAHLTFQHFAASAR